MTTPKSGPVEQPSKANGAQVALTNFEIPQFPYEAGGLLAVEFFSQIDASEYEDVLKKPWKVTHLPPSIQSLTLESFTLGYPAGFLKTLIAELPELRSLVVYSQSFTGTSDASTQDAIAFIEGAKKLRALHLLDVYISPAFVESIGPVIRALEKPLMFIEINYTSRGKDEDLLARVPAAKLPLLIHQGLISCTFNISPPDTQKQETRNASAEDDGVQVLDSRFGKFVVSRLLDEDSAPVIMKHLNITLYPISADELRQILVMHKGLAVLNVSIEVKDIANYKGALVNALGVATNLEQVEIVLCPYGGSEQLDISIDQEEIATLAKTSPKLSSLKVNHLRRLRSSASVECDLVNNKWDIKNVKAGSMTMSNRTKLGKPQPV